MPDEGQETTSSQDGLQDAGRVRKPRKEIQIYRPGMMRKGTDVTLGSLPSNSKPPEEPRKRPPMKVFTETSRLDRISESNRRRSNDTDSCHSYRGDSGSTTPDAASVCSERRDSHSRVKVFTRGGGGNARWDNRRETSSQYNGSEYSSRQSSREDVRKQQPYNSTQSLYNNRQPGGYLDYQSPRKIESRRNYESDHTPRNNRFQRVIRGNNERASMRAETGQRRTVGGRRRNDSINSTQSEQPPQTSELKVDTTSFETQSQADCAPSSSSLVDYYEFCQSMESFGSIDWSQEMEAVQSEKVRLEEEEKTRQLQERLEACSSGAEIQKIVEKEHVPVRGILRLNITEKQHSPQKEQGGRGRQNGRDHYRERRDSDRSSSIGGSIAEGSIAEEDESEQDGERTPTKEYETDRRWSSRGGRQRNTDRNRRNDGSKKQQENFDPNDVSCPISPKYRGGHDVDRTQVPPSRLQGRLTVQKMVASEGAPQRRQRADQQIYQPRRRDEPRTAAPITARESTSVEDHSTADSEDDQMSNKQMSDFAIYGEIAKDQGPRLTKINNKVTSLLPRVSKRDVTSAREVLELSQQLCDIYYEILTKDINFTFTMNLEQHLWKQAFHKIIDSLKTAANSTSSHARALRDILNDLLRKGFEFYNRLVDLYEKEFDVRLDELIVWPSGLPRDSFESVLDGPLALNELSSKKKIVCKSLSRHLLAIGDLYRYYTLVQGSEDYSVPRSWYLKAVLLWPSSGHPYNQLAVVAYFSMLYRSNRRSRHMPVQILSDQRQERVLDEIFFCVRAISANHVYDIAKERLHSRLNSMRKKVEKYEHLLDSETGKVQSEGEICGKLDQPREFWITVNEIAEMPEKSLFETYLSQQPSQLHRRAVSYLVHLAGLLITKIGMETFSSISERAVSQLAALVQTNSPVTAQQLVQLSIIFFYAVHINAIKGEVGTCSAQQQLAVQTVVTIFGVLLMPLHDNINNLELYLTGVEPVPKMVQRVLPAICVIAEWLSCPFASNIYRTMSNVDPLNIQTVTISTWKHLADIVNELNRLDQENLLGKRVDNGAGSILPELLFVASFNPVFPPSPRISHIRLPSLDKELPLSLHVRLRTLFVAAEYIDGSSLDNFFYDVQLKRFCCGEERDDHAQTSSQASSDVLESAADDVILTRSELMKRERDKQKIALIVKPQNLVPDTNTFVDHLDQMKKIAESGRYNLLVPTIVIEELLGLSQSRASSSEHDQFVFAEATKAVAWLKEKVKDTKSSMFTLTTKGKRFPLKIVNEKLTEPNRINDDYILDSCITYIEQTPVEPFTDVTIPPFDGQPVYRNLVLLSEDRGLGIKATSRNIPTRNVPMFIKWAKV